jgi:prepilin peptidase CpaA
MNAVTSTSTLAIWIANAVLAVSLVIATYTDLRDGKVYNKLTFPCILLGFLLNTLFGGLSGSWHSVCGVGVSILVALALAVCVGPAFGGGDLKLIAAIGALRGPEFVMWTVLFSALAGGVLVWVPLIRRRIVGYTLRNLAWNAYRKHVLQEPVSFAEGSQGGKQPFAVAILAGAVLACAWLAF